MSVLKINIGDWVELKKKHPCGSLAWQVERTGYDIWLRCRGCQRLVKLDRSVFEKRYKRHVDTKG